MEYSGLASIAFLPSGNLSGHFIDSRTRKCFGLMGKELQCDRECSHGEDYHLLSLTIINYSPLKEAAVAIMPKALWNSSDAVKEKEEQSVVVERRGQDAARITTACDVHGWDESVIAKTLKGRTVGGHAPLEVNFECEILKAEGEAEAHLRRFLPGLVGQNAVVNIGTMTIHQAADQSNLLPNHEFLHPPPPPNWSPEEMDATFNERTVSIPVSTISQAQPDVLKRVDHAEEKGHVDAGDARQLNVTGSNSEKGSSDVAAADAARVEGDSNDGVSAHAVKHDVASRHDAWLSDRPAKRYRPDATSAKVSILEERKGTWTSPGGQQDRDEKVRRSEDKAKHTDLPARSGDGDEDMAAKLGLDLRGTGMSLEETLRVLVHEELANEGLLGEDSILFAGLGDDARVAEAEVGTGREHSDTDTEGELQTKPESVSVTRVTLDL